MAAFRGKRPSSSNFGIWEALEQNLVCLCDYLEPNSAMFFARLTENKKVLGLSEEKLNMIRTERSSHKAVMTLVTALKRSGPRNEEGFITFMDILEKQGKDFVVEKLETDAGRVKEHGTFYIQALCYVFSTYAHQLHLTEMLDQTAALVNNHDLPFRQVPVTKSTLSKSLYLCPGL